jgi:hypothetical protein
MARRSCGLERDHQSSHPTGVREVDPRTNQRPVNAAQGRSQGSEIEARLSPLGCRKVNLLVFEGSTEAMAFWRALGYAQAPVVEFTKELEDGDTLADRR